MIRKAKFENFKGLRDVEVTFDSPFTVFVGPNGTGKTSVLQGVEFVSELSGPGGAGLSLLLFRSGGLNTQIRLTGTNESGDGWHFEEPASPSPAIAPGIYRAATTLFRVMRGQVQRAAHATEIEATLFGRTFRPKFVASEICQPTQTVASPPPVTDSGHGTPALLGFLKLRDDELFDRIEKSLCELIPTITKVRIDEQALHGQPAQKSLLFDTTYAKKVPAHHMSDGTLYILALIVAVLGPHRPKTLLIDDIDMRLHPKAQYELVTLLKKFLDEFPDLQIIATSHSPYILDKLEPNEVRVTGLGDDGSVVIAPITEHPDFARWKDSMTPGEFWSHTGEEWLKKLQRSAPTP